jgi:hypothetical protein
MACSHLLYACYGSNLLSSRFLAYILGGQISEINVACSSKVHDGSRDPTAPVASITSMVPYRLRFAQSSSRWHGRGVAFLDVSTEVDEDSKSTIVRGWPLTLAQFVDVLKQENGLKVHSLTADGGSSSGSSGSSSPTDDRDIDNPVTAAQIQELLAKGPGNGLELSFHESPGGPLVAGSGWYSWLYYLADDPTSGLPLLTFTSKPSNFIIPEGDSGSAWPSPWSHNAPSVQYSRVIFKGLLECGHPPVEAVTYLNARAMPSEPFTIDQLLEKEVLAEYAKASTTATTATTTAVVEGVGSAAIIVAPASSPSSSSSSCSSAISVIKVGGVLRPTTTAITTTMTTTTAAHDRHPRRRCLVCEGSSPSAWSPSSS